MTTMTAAEYRKITQGTRNRAQGAFSEMLVKRELEMLGVQMVERIETGWRVQRQTVNGRSKIVGATPLDKVAGDYRGLLPDSGRSVLCESKHSADKLVFSALKKHQVKALNDHAQAGGLSLLAWDNAGEVYVMTWPIKGFKRGSSLTPEKAQAAVWGGAK